MSRRAPVLAALALSFTSAAAPVQTPCDVVPPSVGPALCQPCPGGPPVPGARVAGVGLDYVDQWHAQCELYRNDRGIGQCKNNTTCLPGWEKFPIVTLKVDSDPEMAMIEPPAVPPTTSDAAFSASMPWPNATVNATVNAGEVATTVLLA